MNKKNKFKKGDIVKFTGQVGGSYPYRKKGIGLENLAPKGSRPLRRRFWERPVMGLVCGYSVKYTGHTEYEDAGDGMTNAYFVQSGAISCVVVQPLDSPWAKENNCGAMVKYYKPVYALEKDVELSIDKEFNASLE